MNNNKLILKVNNLEKEFGNDIILDKVNLIIHQGDKVALLGQNGTGKSTFVKCITGEENYQGDIELDTSISFAIMEQEKQFDNSYLTFNEYLKDKQDKLILKKEEIEAQFAQPQIYEDSILYEKLLAEHLKLSLRAELNINEQIIKDLLDEMNFEMQDYDKRICDLSGGQKTKLRLAEVLSRNADFFILDEPTNHLDFTTIRWLEKRLFYSKDTFIVISHDRHFVNLVSKKIVEIENSKFEIYDCDYVEYRKRRKAKHDALRHKHFSTQKEKKRMKESEDQKRHWAHLAGSKKLKMQADNLQRRREALGNIPNPDEFLDKFELKFKEGPICGNQIAKATNMYKKFGNLHILEDISFQVENGNRIAIVGKNGCGKSTLLKIISGKENISIGEFKLGENLKIGYLNQEFEDMNSNQRVMDYLWEADQKLMEHHIIAYLIKFGFDYTRRNDKLQKLSGGEKTRVSLVKLMLSKRNVLLLDEPTNHLDVELINSLEKALKSYQGTIIFVSHDRMFVKKVANKLYLIENNKLKEFEGNDLNSL